MAAIDMTTLADVKSWLGLTVSTDDALLTRLITAASDYVQNYLSRDIMQTTYTGETYHGNGSGQLMLRQFPISAVSSVVVYNPSNMTATTTYTAADLLFDERTLYLESGKVFTMGQGNVKVNYTAGYTLANVPFSLSQAVIELLAVRYRERDRIGHVSKSLGGETVTFDIKDMPNSVKTLLNNIMNVVPV